jgi:hypothetical protein
MCPTAGLAPASYANSSAVYRSSSVRSNPDTPRGPVRFDVVQTRRGPVGRLAPASRGYIGESRVRLICSSSITRRKKLPLSSANGLMLTCSPNPDATRSELGWRGFGKVPRPFAAASCGCSATTIPSGPGARGFVRSRRRVLIDCQAGVGSSIASQGFADGRLRATRTFDSIHSRADASRGPTEIQIILIENAAPGPLVQLPIA